MGLFFSLGYASVDVSAFARYERVVHRQVVCQAGVKDVADVILCGVDAVDHANQNTLPGRNCDRAARRDGLRLSNRRGSRSRSVSRSGNGAATTVRERQGHNIVDAECLNIAIYFKTQHCLCAAKIAALQDASILQLQGIGCCACDKQKTQGGCGNKTHETLHCDSPLDMMREVICVPSPPDQPKR